MANDEKKHETTETNEIQNESSAIQTPDQKEKPKAKEPEVIDTLTMQSEVAGSELEEDETPDPALAVALDQNMNYIIPEKGQLLKGKIISINEENALVDCGAKAEAILATKELDGHKEGDEIEGMVVGVDPLTISIKLEQNNKNHSQLRNAFDAGISVTGKITREIKGGFDVDVSGVRAFLPISHLDVSFIKETAPFIGQVCDFKIMEFAENGKQFIVSRAEILKKELGKKLESFWDTIKAGEIRDGVVRSFQSFGAFIDLGGIEGLLHISELSNDYTTHPSDMLKIGEKVKVSILSVDKDKNRISLSMKDLAPDPWEKYSAELVIGNSFKGTVVRKADFGLFVQLAPGIDGLLHVSQIKSNTKLGDADYAIGKTLTGWIRSLDIKNRRVGLTLHEMPSDDPWQNISEKFQVGSIIEGTIEESTQYGVFVELMPGLTGLMPLSELKKIGYKDMSTEFKAQDAVTVKITAIDEKRQRISLLPNEIPEHIVPEAKKPSKKKPHGKKREKPAEPQNGSEQNGGITAFGELLAAALNNSDDQ